MKHIGRTWPLSAGRFWTNRSRQHTGRSRRRGEPDGIQMEKIEYDGGIHVTRIKIATQEAAEKMGKPIGNYITLEADGVLEEEDGIQEKAQRPLQGSWASFFT